MKPPINKALNHFSFKLIDKDINGNVKGLKKNFTPTIDDVKAFNVIAEWKELQEAKVLKRNESLAKLFIHQLILLMRSKVYDSKRSIEVIHEILDKPVVQWCETLQNEIPMLRFNAVGNIKYPIDDVNILNQTELNERNDKIVEEFETELTEAMNYTISKEDVIKFVESSLNTIINKYEK